ncbi:MAG: hypothetical protein E7320_02270 [Clostridiales bacterium]|nr:hypothetical protein [Clostridiales bacterium]
MGLFKIRGLQFSWRRFLGITKLKNKIARFTGVPTTKTGREAKLGRTLLAFLKTKFKPAKKTTSKSREVLEFAALKNLRDGKPVDFSHITNPAYVTKPPLSVDINSVVDYVPQLTELGKQKLEEYLKKKAQ